MFVLNQNKLKNSDVLFHLEKLINLLCRNKKLALDEFKASIILLGIILSLFYLSYIIPINKLQKTKEQMWIINKHHIYEKKINKRQFREINEYSSPIQREKNKYNNLELLENNEENESKVHFLNKAIERLFPWPNEQLDNVKMFSAQWISNPSEKNIIELDKSVVLIVNAYPSIQPVYAEWKAVPSLSTWSTLQEDINKISIEYKKTQDLYQEWKNNPTKQKWLFLSVTINELSRKRDVRSDVIFKTVVDGRENPGAIVKYQLEVERQENRPPNTIKGPTTWRQSLIIGNYYIWSVRNNKITSDKNSKFPIVGEKEEIKITEYE